MQGRNWIALIATGLVLSSFGVARADTTNIGDTTDSNFTGTTYNWENVVQNDLFSGGGVLGADWEANSNYVIGVSWINSTVSFDPSTTDGIGGVKWNLEADAGDTFQNRFPALMQGGKVYRRTGSGNRDVNGAGPFSVAVPDWIELGTGSATVPPDPNQGITSSPGVVVNGSRPDFSSSGGPITFGFVQWGGSSGSSVASGSSATTTLADFSVDVYYRALGTKPANEVAKYSADIGNSAPETPVNQGWMESGVDSVDVTIGGVTDGGTNAWQMRDDANNRAPRYEMGLTDSNLAAMFAEGWEFTATLKAVEGGQFVGWGVGSFDDPGWGLAGRERVGFGVSRSGDDTVISPTHGDPVTILDGGEDFHTIFARGEAGSSMYRFYVDGVPVGWYDIADGGSNDSFDNLISFTSGSTGGTGREALWNLVELKVPEPASLALMGLGLLLTVRRRRA